MANRYRDGKKETSKMARLIDDLTEFEKYQKEVLKKIRQDIAAGMTAPELRKKYAAQIQGRMITDALTEEDKGKAATIGKDIIDRVEGKATEKKEVTHKFSEMSDKELDAILQSEESDLKDMEERFDQ